MTLSGAVHNAKCDQLFWIQEVYDYCDKLGPKKGSIDTSKSWLTTRQDAWKPSQHSGSAKGSKKGSVKGSKGVSKGGGKCCSTGGKLDNEGKQTWQTGQQGPSLQPWQDSQQAPPQQCSVSGIQPQHGNEQWADVNEDGYAPCKKYTLLTSAVAAVDVHTSVLWSRMARHAWPDIGLRVTDKPGPPW